MVAKWMILVVLVLGMSVPGIAQKVKTAPSKQKPMHIIESGRVKDGYVWSIGRATENGPTHQQSVERSAEGTVWRTEAAHDTIYEPTEAGRYREFLPFAYGDNGLRIIVPTEPDSRISPPPAAR